MDNPAAPEDSGHRDPVSALDFTDPLSLPPTDETDRGWGEGPAAGSDGGAAELARFLDEKPPHHF
ncbi:hypothetical protein [Streptomyces macrosporus]|uniref:Uncharacterized protein n=1 Tax=Streptomyces macrosporus TaxID=44032 RepID=A0ABN3KDX0_9ACTN